MQLAVKSSWVSSGWWGEGHRDTEYKTVFKSEYALNKNYVDKYFYTKNDLRGTFDAITEEIIKVIENYTDFESVQNTVKETTKAIGIKNVELLKFY